MVALLGGFLYSSAFSALLDSWPSLPVAFLPQLRLS